MQESDLVELARRAAGALAAGDVVVLAGEVGAGKSTFVRAAAWALGVREAVTSPTYQLARRYEGEVIVNHLDLYRLEEIGAADALDFEEYLDPAAITFIEWAEPALGLLENPSVVELEHVDPATRRVRISGPLAKKLAR